MRFFMAIRTESSTVYSSRHTCRTATPARTGHWRRALSVLAAFVLAAGPVAAPRDAGALIQPVSIAVDGAFTDWNSVLTDTDNVKSDPTGASDSDSPAAGADLALVASTFDATRIYGYARINTTVKGKLEFRMYIDGDGDGLLGATTADRVAIFSYNPTGKFLSGGVAPYTPIAPSGDPLAGNGSTPPGTIGAAVYVADLTACNISSNRIEMRVPWSALGVTAGSPARIQFAVVDTQTTFRVDNANVVSLRHYGVTLVPNSTSSAPLGTTASYSHTITNTGNGTETFTLAATSSLGWTTTIRDGVSGAVITQVSLARGASQTIRLDVAVPAGAAAGAKDDTTLVVTCAARTSVTAAVTDTTYAGPVLVSPNNTGSMAPGQMIEYAHTVTNASAVSQTFALSATSSLGWTSTVHNTVGTLLPTVTLAGGASASIRVRVVVPSSAAIDSVNVTTVRAALQSDATVFDTATDTTTARPGAFLTPNRSSTVGEGRTVTYQHTLTNSWPTSRTFTLSHTSSLGWAAAYYAADGVTPITQITLGPNGASTTFSIRLTVPLSVPVGSSDITSLRATHAATSTQVSVIDTTFVSQLVTYSDDTLTYEKATFRQTETVWAEGRALGTYADVRYSWRNPSGTQVFLSAPVAVEPDGTTVSSYTLPSNAALGTWTAVLLDVATGQEVARVSFTVTINQWLTMTVDRNAINFGALTPEIPSAIENIRISVDSNIAYTFSRSVSGTVSAMGLTITGPAVGVQPSGPRLFIDAYQAIAPWDTDPATPLSVTVAYTVVP